MRDETPLTPEQQLDRIKAVLNKHQDKQRVFYGTDDLSAVAQDVIERYERMAVNTLSGAKSFRDDTLIWIRAMSMVVDQAGNAGAHAEKNARLRGISEMVESIVRKLREMEFNFNWANRDWPDVFASDYPVRHFMDRAHEAERKLEGFDKYLKAIEGMPEDVQRQIKAKVEAMATQNAPQDSDRTGEFDQTQGYDTYNRRHSRF